MTKRPYSTEFTARANPRRYLLSGIPPTLWDRVQRQARKEGVSVRALILTLLEAWVVHAPAREAAGRAEATGEVSA